MLNTAKQQNDALKIIDVVKRYPCIYNPQSKYYGRNNLWDNLWEKIDKELGLRPDTSRTTWFSLRRTHLTFRACQQRMKNSSDPDCTGPWRFEKEMSFIDKYVCDDSGYREDHFEKKITPREQALFNEVSVNEMKLIECIKEHPILTEIFNDNLEEQNEAWDAISKRMGYSAKFCQYWWTKLKKRYKKELWAYKQGKSPKWEHFYKMDFAKVYVSFNIGDTSSLKEQSGIISRYFENLGKLLENAPKEKRAELDNKILNLLLEAELNHSAPKESLQENSIEVLNSPQSNSSENIITNNLDNVEPINKYIVKIIPDGETSLENVSEEYLINFLPDDFNVDAPLIDCQAEEPAKIRDEVVNVETEEEVENVEIIEDVEILETEEEIESVETKEEIDNVEINEEVEYVEIQQVENVKEEVDKVDVKGEIENIKVKEELENMETEKEVENMETEQVKVENVEAEEEIENVEIIEDVEIVETEEEIESVETKEEIERVKMQEVENMNVRKQVETVDIKEKNEEADDGEIKLEEEDEEMEGFYIIEDSDD